MFVLSAFFMVILGWLHNSLAAFFRINFYLLRTFCPHLGSFFCVVSSFTTFRPNFTSGLLQVILPWPRIGMMSLATVFPAITTFHSCCLSHHVFDQVNIWPALVGLETTIFWQCSPGTVETQRSIRCATLGPYRIFVIVFGSFLRWGFLIWELIFIYCGLFVLILVVFFVFCFLCCLFFHYVSAKFHVWPSSKNNYKNSVRSRL